MKQRQATEATADALAALPVADDEGSPSPEDPLFAADGKDAVVEAPVATRAGHLGGGGVEEAPAVALRPVGETRNRRGCCV